MENKKSLGFDINKVPHYSKQYTEDYLNVRTETLIEILDAAHLSVFVESPFEQRGGIMLIAPPGHMKSTMITSAFAGYHDALVLSDINVKTLVNIKDDLIGKRYTTIAFTAYEKLYARHPQTSSNIEATLMAMIEEGFTQASFQDQRIGGMAARALVVAGTFPAMYQKKYNDWAESGFLRRFLWCNFVLADIQELVKGIREWKLRNLGDINRRYPISRRIEYNVNDYESQWLESLIKDQRGDTTPYVLLKKIYTVLKWKYAKEPELPKSIMTDFSGCLKKKGTEMFLPEESKSQAKEATFEL